MFAGVFPLILLAVAAAIGVVGLVLGGQVVSAKACDYGGSGCGLGFYPYHHWGFHYFHWGFVGDPYTPCCNNGALGALQGGLCCDSSLQGQGQGQGPVPAYQNIYGGGHQNQNQGQGQTANVNVEGNNNYVNVEQGQHQEQGQSSFSSPLDNQCWSGDGWGQCGGGGPILGPGYNPNNP